MVLGFLKRLLDTNQQDVTRLTKTVDQINALEEKIKSLSDEELAAKTPEFKQRLGAGSTLDDILPEAFAVAREAARRLLGMRAFDVQIMAAIAFHEGKIAEQKTGEGKTLSAVPALYLNALTEKGVHLITANDYLARRDAGWNAPVFAMLGLSTGVVIGDPNLKGFVYDPEYIDDQHQDPRLRHLKPVARKEAYQADITYGTNTEFGFDYLRDNMANALVQQSQRGHHYAIVDEVDSILIDEARTPLIISAPDSQPTSKYLEFSQMVRRLSSDTDYTIDEKIKSAALTDHGIRKVEKILGVTNLYEKDFETVHHIENALKAMTLYLKDREYIIRDGQVVIVDEFTGRLMPGRRWSQGLHQAVEAKEGVQIQQESRTLATISLQNYFRMYTKLGGMTGTAATEAEEFRKIYNLETVVVPTHRQIQRQDHPDVVYKTPRAKYAAIAALVEELYKQGQPVLVGTTSIDKNEIVSQLLKHKKIPHQVLNAKNHEHEASIIAQAGAPRAVTVATNIAGRGVDIVLGGAKPQFSSDEDPKAKDQYEKQLADWQKNHDSVVDAGGLYVIGTERHESRRIDNQLRGRSGRQGDPGASKFFVSLQDDIMRLFGGEQVANLMTMLKLPEDQPLEAGMVSRAIEQAQVKVEGFHFDQRSHVVKYDDVLNKQREIIYKLRQQTLEDHDFSQDVRKIAHKQIEQLVNVYAPSGYVMEEFTHITQGVVEIIPMPDKQIRELNDQISQHQEADGLRKLLIERIDQAFTAKEKELSTPVMRQVERFTYRMTIDQLWMDHLDSIDDLREGIGLRGYAQRDPLVEYKAEAFNMFENLINQIDHQVVRRILRAQVQLQSAPGVEIQRTQAVHETKDLEQELVEEEPDLTNLLPDTEPEIIPTKAQPKSSGGLTQSISNLFGRGKSSSNDLDAFASAMSGLQTTSAQTPARVSSTVQSSQKSTGPKLGRNDLCWCGSGKKFKKCHYPQLPA